MDICRYQEWLDYIEEKPEAYKSFQPLNFSKRKFRKLRTNCSAAFLSRNCGLVVFCIYDALVSLIQFFQ